VSIVKTRGRFVVFVNNSFPKKSKKNHRFLNASIKGDPTTIWYLEVFFFPLGRQYMHTSCRSDAPF